MYCIVANLQTLHNKEKSFENIFIFLWAITSLSAVVLTIAYLPLPLFFLCDQKQLYF